MFWLGWADTKTHWSPGSLRLMEEAGSLLAAHLESMRYERHYVLARCQQALPFQTRGERCSLTLEAPAGGSEQPPIEWVGAGPPVDALAAGDPSKPLPVIEVTIRDAGDKPVAGVRLIETGLFTLEEIRLALRMVYESHEARPGCFPVLASARRPLPILHQHPAGAASRANAVFQCENPACRAFRQEVLLASAESVAELRAGWGIAYPCPSCPGDWQARWALSFKRAFAPEDPASTSPTVEYPIPPTKRRRGPVAGTPMIAGNEPTTVDLNQWVFRGLPTGLETFMRSSRLPDLHAALRDAPERCGPLLPGFLTAETLRSLVEFTRRLPMSERLGGLATALAHGWYPRRVSAYKLSTDAAQETHHPYIAFSPEAFIDSLLYYGVLSCSGTFLDVGCGIGEKVFLAYALGIFEQCDGLEYDPRTLAVASFLQRQAETLDPYPIRFIEADALTFEDYHRYDVIYMYRPLRDPTLMGKLFRHIAGEMRPNAIVFDVYQTRCGLKKIADDRFVTIRTDPSNAMGVWDVPISLQDFLIQMGMQ